MTVSSGRTINCNESAKRDFTDANDVLRVVVYSVESPWGNESDRYRSSSQKIIGSSSTTDVPSEDCICIAYCRGKPSRQRLKSHNASYQANWPCMSTKTYLPAYFGVATVKPRGCAASAPPTFLRRPTGEIGQSGQRSAKPRTTTSRVFSRYTPTSHAKRENIT